MKSTAERIEYLKHLINRKEGIRTKHLLSIKKHMAEVGECEEYIRKHQAELKILQSIEK